MNTKTNLILSAILMVTLVACDRDDDSTPPEETKTTFSLDLEGLESLGPDYVYEGWLIVDDAPVTTGVFSVDDNGTADQSSFEVEIEDLENATTFVLTIEPAVGDDPAPSDVHILAGAFNGNTAELTIDHPAALGTGFESSAGSYILATPTDDDMSNESSGIWFLDNSSGAPEAGLELPTLPAGWAYEGWAVINGVPVSTGTFLSASGADDLAIYSGSNPGPPYPGEDFLENAPSGLTFPTNLAGATAVISVEPVPDNSPAPFTLKPLAGMIPTDIQDHTVSTIGQNLSFPTGRVQR